MKRIVVALFILTLSLSILSISVSAEEDKVAKPSIQVLQDDNSIFLETKEIKDAAGYIFYYSTTKNGDFIKLIDTQDPWTTITKLDLKTRYYFTVQVYYIKDGQYVFSEFADRVSNILVPISSLKPPVLTSAKQSNKTTTIAFNKVAGAKGYNIYYSTKKDSGYKKLVSTTKTSYSTDSLKEGSVYYFKVNAFEVVDGDILYSEYSNILSVTKNYEIAQIEKYTPTINVVQNKAKVIIAYNKVPYAKSYIIYVKKPGDTKYSRLAETSKLSYSSSKFKIDTKYSFKVRAVATTAKLNFYSGYSKAAGLTYKDPDKVIDLSKTYKNSYGITTNHQNNYNFSALNSLVSSYSQSVGFFAMDLTTGKTVGYNANKEFHTASTVKLGYCLYVYKLIAQGKASFNDTITYTPADYVDESGSRYFGPFGKVHTTAQVLATTIKVSDNNGYYMLRRKYGSAGYMSMLRSLGCSDAQKQYSAWGNLTPADLGKIWKEIYAFKDTGNAGKVFWNSLLTAQFNFIKAVIYEHPVAHKSGFNARGYHDSGIVLGERPYIMVVMTNTKNNDLPRTVRAVDTFMKQVN